MADAALTLPPALARFVEAQVASGDYPDAETLIHEAILRLMPRAEADAFRLARFNALVQVGLDQLDRGERIEVTDTRAWLDTLGRDRSADEAA